MASPSWSTRSMKSKAPTTVVAWRSAAGPPLLPSLPATPRRCSPTTPASAPPLLRCSHRSPCSRRSSCSPAALRSPCSRMLFMQQESLQLSIEEGGAKAKDLGVMFIEIIAKADFNIKLTVEGLASFLVVFWSCVAALMQEMYHTLTFPIVCLIVALTVAFVLSWLGPAHFNPAVTITFTVFRHFPWTKLPFYVMVQIGGSVLACLSVNGIMKPQEVNFYGTVPMIGHTKLPFLMEFLGSAVLMIVIATVAGGSVSQTVGGLAIGGAVGTLGLIIGPVSGGSMNPARSLGPAIVLDRYTSVWIYIVAPISGMLLGALCNRIIRQSDGIVAFLCGNRVVTGSVGIGSHESSSTRPFSRATQGSRARSYS